MAQNHWIPAIHALHVIEVVEARGYAVAPLLRLAGMDRAALSAPTARLPLDAFAALAEAARALTGDALLGVALGLKMQVSAHGFVGFAAMTARTLGGALEIAIRFAPTRSTAFGLRLERGPETTALVIDELAPLGAARDSLVMGLMLGLWRIGCDLTRHTLTGHAEVAFLAPPHAERLRQACGAAGLGAGQALSDVLRFGAAANRMCFATRQLDLPLLQADAAAQALARAQCEAQLAALAADRVSAEVRVRALLPDPAGGIRSAEAVAAELGWSVRTLKRRLAEAGTGYAQLAEAWRAERAQQLLSDPGRTVEQVALALGYTDAANFSRAFRRWFGVAPGAWRKN